MDAEPGQLRDLSHTVLAFEVVGFLFLSFFFLVRGRPIQRGGHAYTCPPLPSGLVQHPTHGPAKRMILRQPLSGAQSLHPSDQYGGLRAEGGRMEMVFLLERGGDRDPGGGAGVYV